MIPWNPDATSQDHLAAARERPLRKVCAWCDVVLVDGPAEPVTHGICTRCVERMREDGAVRHEVRSGSVLAVPARLLRAWARGFVYAYGPLPMRLHNATRYRCARSTGAWERLLRLAGFSV
jgi:hypothetical protein